MLVEYPLQDDHEGEHKVTNALAATDLKLIPLTEQALPQAEEIAQRLGAPVLPVNTALADVAADNAAVLWVGPQGVSLQLTDAAMQPVCVDFADPSLLRRASEAGARKQDLVRALGLTDPERVTVIDATAGWGRDSGVLAALGFRVLMIERHPVVAELLADGLARAQAHPSAVVRALAGRLCLHSGDAREVLHAGFDGDPFVVLIDPMFPERDKSAAVRKQMKFFHQLVGPDEDAESLLVAALESGAARVAMKRPRKSSAVSDRKPTAVISGKSTRFDVYAIKSLKR